jgi:hypothetical protein
MGPSVSKKHSDFIFKGQAVQVSWPNSPSILKTLEDEGIMFPRNTGTHVPSDIASYARRLEPCRNNTVRTSNLTWPTIFITKHICVWHDINLTFKITRTIIITGIIFSNPVTGWLWLMQFYMSLLLHSKYSFLSHCIIAMKFVLYSLKYLVHWPEIEPEPPWWKAQPQHSCCNISPIYIHLPCQDSILRKRQRSFVETCTSVYKRSVVA